MFLRNFFFSLKWGMIKTRADNFLFCFFPLYRYLECLTKCYVSWQDTILWSMRCFWNVILYVALYLQRFQFCEFFVHFENCLYYCLSKILHYQSPFNFFNFQQLTYFGTKTWQDLVYRTRNCKLSILLLTL